MMCVTARCYQHPWKQRQQDADAEDEHHQFDECEPSVDSHAVLPPHRTTVMNRVPAAFFRRRDLQVPISTNPVGTWRSLLRGCNRSGPRLHHLSIGPEGTGTW